MGCWRALTPRQAMFRRSQATLVRATSSTKRWDTSQWTYADQTERDHAALKAAVRKGSVEAFREA